MAFVLNGRKRYSVSVDESDECLNFAAQKLAEYIHKIYSCEISIGGKAESYATFYLEKVADSSAVQKTGTLENDGYAFIIEDHSVRIISLETRGVLYGVFAFLKSYCGCRFFAYDCEKVPYINETEIQCGVFVKNPTFASRNALNAQCADYEFRAKRADYNNFVYVPYRYGGFEEWFNGKDGSFSMHNTLAYVEPEIYFDKHPELFSVKNGKAVDICFTSGITDNGDFDDSAGLSCAGIIVDKILDKIKRSSVRFFMIGQSDSWGGNEKECQCPNCVAARKKHGGSSGVLVRFLNAVSREVEKRKEQENIHKPTYIVGFAYSQTFEPPVTYNSGEAVAVDKQVVPDKNVKILLCTIGYKNMPVDDEKQTDGFYAAYKAWFKLTKNVFIWDYCCNYSEYLWYFPGFSAMMKNIKTAAKNKAAGYLALFSYGDKNEWQASMNGYVAAELMRDATLSETALRDEYIEGYYGNSSKYVKKLIARFETHYELLKNNSDFRFKMTKDDDIGFNVRFYPEKLLTEAIAVMDEAIAELDKNSADYDIMIKRLKCVRLTPIRMLHYNYYAYYPRDKKGYYALGEKLLADCEECGINSIGENIPVATVKIINDAMKAIDLSGKGAWDVYRMLYQGYVFGYRLPPLE